MRLEAANAQTSRRPLLWISLLLTVALVYWQWSAEQDAADEAVVADSALTNSASAKNNPTTVAPPATASTVTAVVASEVDSVHEDIKQPVEAAASLLLSRKLPATKISHALFAAHEWLPPPPKPQAPPPPQAPPVPYTYVGSMQDMPEGSTVILMQQKKVLMPTLKSQITPQWRLDSEDAQSVYFTYMPLNKAVVLSKAKTAASGQRQPVADTEDNIPLEQ